ncbi:hypothetical protein F6W96_24375 [Nocardia terpenica]|uniref:carbonic anhydrase n=2 Tax=Nocardia terpenica TaxID=455432 RepID=A0A6G9ZGA0_9NOCA|nr:hypothetical protein F6W96_24375 [Nocardia terpenica]
MLTVAVIASVETLLSAVAVERMRPRPKARRGEEVEARRDEEVEARRGEKGEARRDEKGEAQRGHKIEVLRGRKVKARRGQKVEGHRGQKVEARRGEKVEARRGERVEAQQGHEVEARWGNEIEARRGREVKARRSYEEEERPGYEEEVRRGRGEEVRRGREVKVRWGREVKVRRGHKGRTDLDRELVGQGMANVVSGLVGGLPVAAVIVRSVVNVKAGARSRVSTMLSGGWMLVFAVALVDVVRQIPRAALAGVLIVIGMGLVKLAYVRMARRTGDLVVYAATVLVVVFGNLLLGMVVGLVLAFALLLWRVVRVAISARPVGGGRWLVTVDGTCTFLALPRLVGELAAVPPAAPVIVELTVDFLDHAAHDALRDWADGHEKSGGTVEFVEMGADRRLLDDVLGPWRRTAQGDPIVAGVAAYHRRHAHLVRPHLGRLRDVQHPDSLFLTCADSRIVPNVITNSGPGDLFTVRNIGNLVPADGRDSSVEAALVYALDTLRVRSVVVCGHSGCGAMDALFHERVTGPGLDDWLAHGRPALDRYRAGHPVAAAAAEAGFGEIDRLGMVNVAVQLEALTRHPVVRRAVLARGVVLSGLFFDISTARVLEITIDGVDEIEDTTEPATALPV